LKALLDTHVLLWWLSSVPRLSPQQEEVLRGASEEEPLWVSDITLWEIATLSSLGRIKLHLPLREWLEQATAPPLVQRLPISPAVAAEVAALPDSFHRDPADRIIVASARVLGATLLTQDRRIVEAEIVPTLS
jgi:PIN domain nuclease of toxin-antitoxin system